jgi:DNA-directed RNA polymerase specialized sigma24 family protein
LSSEGKFALHGGKHLNNKSLIANRIQENPAVFDARFSRSRELLCFIACCVLGGNEGLEEALRNCWLAASRNPPKFESESVFRSWLLRILIHEALAVVRRKHIEETRGTVNELTKSLSPRDGEKQIPRKANSSENSSCLVRVIAPSH